MTVVSIFLTSFLLQGAKPSDLRVVEVKAAGLAVSVPKAWAQNPKDGNVIASLNIPVADSKVFGKMDIGYVDDESKDVDGFLDAAKNVLTIGGNTVERQWKVDIMSSSLALTRFSKGDTTTVRGVMFKPVKSKFVISVSGPTAQFDKVEPYLLSTLESMREIKMVQPKRDVIAMEKKIHITREPSEPAPKLPISAPVMLGTKSAIILLPAGSKFTKSGDSAISCMVPGITNPVLVTAYSSEGNPPSLIFQTKAADTSKLFRGAIQRIDQTSLNHGDKQIRDFIWRTGMSEKNGGPLMTVDCVTTQAAPMFLYSSYSNSGASQFAHDRTLLSAFLTSIRLVEK